MQRTLLVAAVLLAAGLSGCIGLGGSGDDAGDEAAGTASVTGAVDEDGRPIDGQAVVRDVVFAGLDGPVSQTQWFNGTFELAEHSYPKGLVTSQATGEYDPDKRIHDVSSMVPRGVPATLVAEINADVGEGDVDIWFNAPQDEVWATDFDTPYGGYSRIEYTIVHTSSEPVELVVRYDEIDDSEAFDYTLYASVSARPDVVPPGVPVTVPVGGGTTIDLHAVDPNGHTRVLGWDGADAFLGDLALEDGHASVTVGLDETPGEYVLMPAGDSPVRISVTNAAEPGAADGTITPSLLRQAIVESAPHGPSGDTTYSWSYDLGRVPLQVGFFVAGPDVSKDFSGSLVGPAGTLFEVDIEDGPWLEAGFFFLTEMGDPNLTVGTYEAAIEFGAGAGPEDIVVVDYVTYYAR